MTAPPQPDPDRIRIRRELAIEVRDAIATVLVEQAKAAAILGRIASEVGVPLGSIRGVEDETLELLVEPGTRRRRRWPWSR